MAISRGSLIISGLLLALITYQAIMFILPSTQKQSSFAMIGQKKVTLEFARTEAEKTKGLGYRDSLPQNTGMLFVYDSPKIYTFWMEGMKFALDFIWIENSVVADITENVPPPSQTNNKPVIIRPQVPVRYILEVNAGWVKSNNIKRGDVVELTL